PLGSNRSFVQSWRVRDLQSALPDGLRGRSPAIGEKLFVEATCAQCHKFKGRGGAVGPDLHGVLGRHKGQYVDVLREMLDPSHKVDAKYAVRIVYTTAGKVISGVVTREDNQEIAIVANPEDPKPLTIKRTDIDEIVQSSKSLMPKALLDRFSKDEILELIAYITQP
ncbi:MAG: c-type cytochrome, partial [Planctomycetales bacterium]|nr:c-type cytochrome [Planctomycetales bacterium]